MKTTIPASIINLIAPLISSVIPRNTSLPVLSMVRITAGNGCLRIQATDLDRRVKFEMGDPPELFDALVPWSFLLAAAKKNPPFINLDVEPRIGYLMYSVNGVQKKKPFDTLKISEFPDSSLSESKKETDAYPVGPEFFDTIKKSRPFSSTDETRYVLVGQFVDIKKQVIVSTDGKFMSLLDAEIPKFNLCEFNEQDRNGFIIPDHKFFSLSLPSGRPASISLGATSFHKDEKPRVNTMRYQFDAGVGKVTFLTKLIEGNYPNYRQVVPSIDGFHSTVRFHDPEDVLKKLRQLGLKPEEFVWFLGVDDELQFLTKDSSFTVSGSCSEEIGFACALKGFCMPLSMGFSKLQIEGDGCPSLFTGPLGSIVSMPMSNSRANQPNAAHETASV